ncbi:Ig-like domain-containing protein, partial [Moritella sp. JT01]|uniref:Ig-like domain-containing protein n=1 Tax=Moritella sp. JT01 TaxID=756698 RepID=UPI0012F897B3
TVTVNGQDYTTTVDGSGNYTVDVNTTDLQADNTIDASVASSDAAGNTVVSNAVEHAISFDTVADAGTITIGTVAGDDVINAVEAGAATIAVSGTAIGGDISTGDTVTVTVNGTAYTTTVDGSGNYSVDVNTTDLQADNTIDASVASSDTAGNTIVSNAAEHAVTFDTTVSANTITIAAITDDTGIDNNDFKTTDTNLIVNGSLANTLQSDETLQISTDNGTTWVDVSSVTGISWTHDDTANTHSADFDYDLRIVDIVGNQGATAQQTVEINIAPTTSATTIDAIEDTPYILSVSDFNFADSDASDALVSIRIDSLPSDGELQLYDGSSWNSVTNGQTVSITDINADNLRFVNDEHESGQDYSDFDFSVSDGAEWSNSVTATVNVEAVADAPTLTVSSGVVSSVNYVAPQGAGLFVETFNNVTAFNISDVSGSNAGYMEQALANETPDSTDNLLSLTDAGSTINLAADSAVKATGLIYLEAGNSYEFTGYRDDTFHMEIGGEQVFSQGFDSWGSYTSTAFVPSESGYYSFEMYAYNASGAGSYDVSVKINGGAAQELSVLPTYTDINEVDSLDGQRSGYVENSNNDGGFYPVRLNEGVEGTDISLSSVNAALVDLDGSESLVITVSGVPVGAVISDGTNSVTSDGSTIDISDWDLATLTFNGLATGDSTTHTLSFTATSTEVDGIGANETASSTVELDVIVTDTAPVSVDDVDSVGYGGTIYGNVITGAGGQDDGADTLGVDTVTLTSVNGQNLVNGELTLDTTNGLITFHDDGSYQYTSDLADTAIANGNLESSSWNDSGIILYGFNDSNADSYDVYQSDSPQLGLNPSNLNSAINTAHSNISNNGIGVGSGDSSTVGFGESIVLDLGVSTKKVSLSFAELSNNEYISVYGYDASGNLVDSIKWVSGEPDNTVSEEFIFSTEVSYISVYQYYNSHVVLTGAVIPADHGVIPDETFDYNIVDSDGDSSDATLTIEHSGDSTAFDDSGTVFESGLTDGTAEGVSTTVLTGNLLDNDAGIGASTVITSVDGIAAGSSSSVTVNMDQGSLTVYVEDDGSHRAGDYTYTLTNAVQVAGNGTVDTINYQLTDQNNGHQTTAQFNVNIVDDAPVANNVELTLEAASEAYTVNLIIVLDKSGSMGWSAGDGTGRSRMEVAKEAITSMLAEYDKVGNVNVQFVAFNYAATKSPWFEDDLFKAMDYLDTQIQPGGGTYYDNALDSVMDNYQVPAGNAADKSLVYFMSDGAPTGSHGINSTDQATWEAFLDNNNIDTSFSIGIGGSTSLNELNPIGYPNTNDSGELEPNTIRITSAAELSDTLLSTIDSGILNGNVSLLAASGNAGAALGADGGYISTIAIDGVTYTYQPGDANSVISVVTVKGGTLTLDLATLNYSYNIELDNTITGEQDIFQITIVDNDGDSTQLNMTINLEYQANLDANRDLILTNQNGITTLEIPTLALMHNDTKGASAEISSISDETNATVIGNGTPLETIQVTVASGSNINDVSFDYTLNNSGANDQAEVTFEEVSGATITGGEFDEILLGGDNADTLIGNAGDDSLVAGAGDDDLSGGIGDDLLMGQEGGDTLSGGADDDILIGGAGNDILTGGTGIDTAVWLDGDQGTEQAPAVDHITDFNINEDKLDLSDLLQSVNSGELDDYLDFSFATATGGTVTTTINIHTEGAGSAVSQVIILDSVDLRDAYTNVDISSPSGINSILDDVADPLIF